MGKDIFIIVAGHATDCDDIRFAALVQSVETQQPVMYASHCGIEVTVAPDEARAEILGYSAHRLRRLECMPARIEAERRERLQSVQEEVGRLRSVLRLCCS